MWHTKLTGKVTATRIRYKWCWIENTGCLQYKNITKISKYCSFQTFCGSQHASSAKQAILTPNYTGFFNTSSGHSMIASNHFKCSSNPFIDLSRNEPTYIYYTLFCAIDHPEKLNKEGFSVTLNSPIGQTTVEIVESQSLAQIVG